MEYTFNFEGELAAEFHSNAKGSFSTGCKGCSSSVCDLIYKLQIYFIVDNNI
jgi:hypothetical protein